MEGSLTMNGREYHWKYPQKQMLSGDIQQRMAPSVIRPVRGQDAGAIMGIYNQQILQGTATFETEPLSEEMMRIRIMTVSSAFPYLVYERGGHLAGYCYAHFWKARKAYQHTLETAVYVSSDYRRQGIGIQLMKRLIEECRFGGWQVLIACITADNRASIALHLKLGFQQVSHFRKVGRKFDRWLDVSDYELILR